MSQTNRQRAENKPVRTRQQSKELASKILEATINLKSLFTKHEKSNKKPDVPGRTQLAKVLECLELLNE